MKIQNIFIGVLFLLLGYSGYQDIVFIDEQKKDSNNLIKRIIKAETNIDNIVDHLNTDAVDILAIEKNLLLEIENLSEGLTEQRKTSSTFYEMYFSTQAQRIEKETEEPVEPLERQYDEETGLHVPIFKEEEKVLLPIEVPVVKITTASSCPTPHTRLLPYINHVRLDRTYSFIITYDVVNSEISNPRFNKKIPSRLRNAIIKYVNSFQTKGDIQDCYVPIKILGG